MRKLPYLQVSVAMALAFVLAWAPALAQESGPLPAVEWPSESRFASTFAGSEEAPAFLVVVWPCEARFAQLSPEAAAHAVTSGDFAWPCEARYIALTPVLVTADGELAVVNWPCESRFVGEDADMVAMAGVDWPCEERFVTLMPMSPALEPVSLVLVNWPCEARFDPLLALAPCTEPTAETLAAADPQLNKLLYREAVIAYFADGATDQLFDLYPEELALARIAEWRSWQTAFSGLEVTLDFQVAEGNRVVSCWTFSGIQHGEFMGMEPTDAPMSFQVLYAAQFEDGHIVGEMGQLDRQTFFETLDAEEGHHTS